MSKSYQPWTQDQAYLLPPSLRDWLAEDHLAWFILEVVSQLDLSAVERAIQSKDARGQRPYHPSMMVALLVYAYCTGVYTCASHRAGMPGGRGVSGDYGQCAAVLHDGQRVSSGAPGTLQGVVRRGAQAVSARAGEVAPRSD